MTATNMCSNFGGKWDSPPLLLKQHVCTNIISYVDNSYHFVNFSTFFIRLTPLNFICVFLLVIRFRAIIFFF